MKTLTKYGEVAAEPWGAQRACTAPPAGQRGPLTSLRLGNQPTPQALGFSSQQ